MADTIVTLRSSDAVAVFRGYVAASASSLKALRLVMLAEKINPKVLGLDAKGYLSYRGPFTVVSENEVIHHPAVHSAAFKALFV